MAEINTVVLAYGAVYLISAGLTTNVTGKPDWLRRVVWFPAKILPVAAGTIIAFNLYARFMGWPV